MDISFIKQSNGSFLPAYNSDWEKAKKFKPGEDYLFTHKKVRSPGHHRKYMGLVRLAYNNQTKYQISQRGFRKTLEMKAGYAEPVIIDGKEVYKLPLSIAYDKLDQHGFKDLYSKVLDVILGEFEWRSDIEEQIIDYF